MISNVWCCISYLLRFNFVFSFGCMVLLVARSKCFCLKCWNMVEISIDARVLRLVDDAMNL